MSFRETKALSGEAQRASFEIAQTRFLQAVATEVRQPELLSSPQRKQATYEKLHEFFIHWMEPVLVRLSDSAHPQEAVMYARAYQSWLEHLANMPLAQAIDQETFDQYEPSLDEEIAARARVFRAIATDYGEWPILVGDFLRTDREGILATVNMLRGFFDRRVISTHAAQQIGRLGLVIQGGAIGLPVRLDHSGTHTPDPMDEWMTGREARQVVLQQAERDQASPERKQRLKAHVQAFLRHYPDTEVPVDILEAIRETSKNVIRYTRRHLLLEGEVLRASDHERADFQKGLRSIEVHLQKAHEQQERLLALRDIVEEAVEIGVLSSSRLSRPELAEGVFARILE